MKGLGKNGKVFIQLDNKIICNVKDSSKLILFFFSLFFFFFFFFFFFLFRKLFKSDKKCDLSYANIQGKEALIKKFQNSQVLSEDIAYQPKLFYSSGSRAGQEQPWPNSNSNKSRSKD
jgi:hypothetical protein